MGGTVTIGIDLGTSNSCVALHVGKRPEIILNSEGSRTTPSVVTFKDDSGVMVGDPAQRQAIMNPQRTVTAVKRLVGRRFDASEVTSLRAISPYEIVRAPNGDAWVKPSTTELSPPEVQSHILEKLRASASQYVGEAISRAVITVPAFFDETQRQATRHSATIAGLDAARIVSEPTAAALAYGYAQTDEKRLAVVDLGGGTFDVTVMIVRGHVFEVLATSGDMLFGGADFDRAIAEALAIEIKSEHHVDVHDDPVALQRLVTEAGTAKKQLTELDQVHISLPFLAQGPNGQVNFERTISRSEFEQWTLPLVQKLEAPCRAALSEATVGMGEIDDVLLVGGMTRSPVVQRKVGELFGKRPSLRINPDEAVATGAALLAAIIDGRIDGAELVDVAPHTIGLKAAGDKYVPLVARSTQLPTSAKRAFGTTQDNQTFVEVQVLQGEDPVASKNRRLARVKFDGLTPAPRGKVKVKVTFSVDANGLLSVSAQEHGTDKAVDANIVAASGLGDAEVMRIADERRRARGEDVPAPKRSNELGLTFEPVAAAPASRPALSTPTKPRPAPAVRATARRASNPSAPSRAEGLAGEIGLNLSVGDESASNPGMQSLSFESAPSAPPAAPKRPRAAGTPTPELTEPTAPAKAEPVMSNAERTAASPASKRPSPILLIALAVVAVAAAGWFFAS